MAQTTLGSTGARVSEFALGTAMFGREFDGGVATTASEAHDILDAFADAGGNFVDTANTYADGESERIVGDWLAKRDRGDFVVASKLYWNQVASDESLSRRAIRAEIEGTLDRLGTDYLDVYYIHRWDDETPIAEILRTLDRLVDEGKVDYLGISTAAAWKLTKALWTSDIEGLERFEVTQPKFNAAYRDPVRDYLDVAADQGLAVCPYSPLEGGLLTGKYARDADAPEGSRGDVSGWDVSERQWDVLEAVEAVAAEEDATPAQVALRWLADHERVTAPILGARTVEQIEENLGVLDVSLAVDQRERITDAYA
ncbi:MAG: aldo/keto reductase [Halarchaeum sp.]